MLSFNPDRLSYVIIPVIRIKDKNIGKLLLIFHSTVDKSVGIDNAAHIYKLTKHPTNFISLDDTKYVVSVVAA